MFLNCPRCDSNCIDSAGNCGSCGYTLRISCSSCGNRSIPTARFCGKCGSALNLNSWLKQKFRQNVTLASRFKLRKFAAGIAFGTFLGIFAFGSMGMNSESASSNRPNSSFTPISSLRISKASIFEQLNEFRNSRNPQGFVSIGDLKSFTEVITQNLSSLNEVEAAGIWQSATSEEQVAKIRAFCHKGQPSRSGIAMLLFNLATDYLGINHRDFTENCLFSDIPRFHFLSIPTQALHCLGIRLEKSSSEFGGNDSVTVEELYRAGIALCEANEIRLKQKVFCTLQPN
ncbi:MAG: zinc ribbon domain-containing protein [Candidatus Rifleibacteriota bacterium]